MSKDRSLGDFVGEETSETESDTPAAAEPATDVDTGDPVETDAVDPATPTYRFDPDGATCDECGERVEKRWHDDGQFVCADCKDW